MTIHSAILIQYQRVIDRQTDRRTDRQTHVKITCYCIEVTQTHMYIMYTLT